MGKINQGILGGVSGTVGTVVGGSWKGISYIRGKAQSVANPNTERQQMQRGKFGLVVNFLKPLAEVVAVGYKHQAIKMSGFNAASSLIMSEAITGSFPNYSIDYSKVLLSMGKLTNVEVKLDNIEPKFIRFNWSDNTGVGNAKADDRVIMVAYFSTISQAVYQTWGATRSDTSDGIALPEEYRGLDAHCWIACQSASGDKMSNSKYLGSIRIN